MAADGALGHALAQQVLAGGMAWTGERVNDYIGRLGRTLARSSGSHQTMTFRVIYSRQVGAQALPGGYVFVSSAIISAAESENELAAVLAHEVAHVNNCDWRQRETKPRLFSRLLPFIRLCIFAGPRGIAAGFATGLSVPLAQARFSPAIERKADRLAIQYMTRAGYDPVSCPGMLERLEALESERASPCGGVFARHSTASSRKRAVEMLPAGLPVVATRVNSSPEFAAVRNEVLRYDEVYARALDLPESDKAPPKLRRRPLQKHP